MEDRNFYLPWLPVPQLPLFMLNMHSGNIGFRSISQIWHIRDCSSSLPILHPHRMRNLLLSVTLLLSLFLSLSRLNISDCLNKHRPHSAQIGDRRLQKKREWRTDNAYRQWKMEGGGVALPADGDIVWPLLKRSYFWRLLGAESFPSDTHSS